MSDCRSGATENRAGWQLALDLGEALDNGDLEGLTAVEIAVMREYALRSGSRDGRARPVGMDAGRLARFTGFSERSVQRARASLRERGLLIELKAAVQHRAALLVPIIPRSATQKRSVPSTDRQSDLTTASSTDAVASSTDAVASSTDAVADITSTPAESQQQHAGGCDDDFTDEAYERAAAAKLARKRAAGEVVRTEERYMRKILSEDRPELRQWLEYERIEKMAEAAVAACTACNRDGWLLDSEGRAWQCDHPDVEVSYDVVAGRCNAVELPGEEPARKVQMCSVCGLRNTFGEPTHPTCDPTGRRHAGAGAAEPSRRARRAGRCRDSGGGDAMRKCAAGCRHLAYLPVETRSGTGTRTHWAVLQCHRLRPGPYLWIVLCGSIRSGVVSVLSPRMPLCRVCAKAAAATEQKALLLTRDVHQRERITHAER